MRSTTILHILDALHLSIPSQGLTNGDTQLTHAGYSNMPPYPGVGKFKKNHFYLSYIFFLCFIFLFFFF